MKARKGLTMREVCGEQILVAEGKENIDFTNIVSMNEPSAFLWKELEDKDFDVEMMAELLVNNYQIDENTPLSMEQARKDAATLLDSWIEAGIVLKD
jgi:hypothetical protein